MVDSVEVPATTPMVNEKPWLSKRVWLNVLTLLALLFPSIQIFVSDNPQAFTTIFSLANLLLTFITKDKVSLSD